MYICRFANVLNLVSLKKKPIQTHTKYDTAILKTFWTSSMFSVCLYGNSRVDITLGSSYADFRTNLETKEFQDCITQFNSKTYETYTIYVHYYIVSWLLLTYT